MPALAVAPTELDRVHGERALDDVLVGAWEELTANRGAVCPVCGETMEPEYGAHARPVRGRCNGCGTTLS